MLCNTCFAALSALPDHMISNQCVSAAIPDHKQSFLFASLLVFCFNVMERAAKLARLEDFRRSKPSCSASAMSAILQDIAKNGLPELRYKEAMSEARDDVINTDTAYGKLLRTIFVVDKAGEQMEIALACPFATFAHFVNQSTTARENSFRAFLKQRLLETPPSIDEPWDIILYTDEVTPGNPIAPVNHRKFHIVYWSFMQLGSNALAREEAWFPLLIECSCIVNRVHAGISQVFKECIKAFFQPGGLNFTTNGLLLEFPDGDVRIWAKLGGILQDGGAHKYVYMIRGDGASKFCMLCRNLFTESSNVCDVDGTRLLRCNCIKLEELVPMSGVDLRKNARFLAAQVHVLRPEPFMEMQQALGLTYAPHALLLDRELDSVFDPCEVYQHDNMHGLFNDGVVNLVIYLLFEHFIGQGMRNIYQVFGDYISRWKWPKRINAGSIPDIFSADRADKHRKAQHIKCQASDLLSTVPVLAHFTKTVLLRSADDDGKKACEAFLALALVCELIADTSRVKVAPELLLGEVHRFLDLFVQAWGFEWLSPKCHWMLHYPEALQANGRLFNCFCLERKHRVGKRYAEDVQNINKNSSKNIMKEILCHQLGRCKQPEAFSFDVGLIGGRPAPKNARDHIIRCCCLDRDDVPDDTTINVALTSRINALEICASNDVVLVQDGSDKRVAKVAQHFEFAGMPLSLIHTGSFERAVPNTSMSIWTLSANAEVWETKNILAAIEYTVFPNGSVGILMPRRFA